MSVNYVIISIYLYTQVKSITSFESKGVLSGVGDSVFANNYSPVGAVIYAVDYSIINLYGSAQITNNTVQRYAVMYLGDSNLTLHDSGNVKFTNNVGSLMGLNSIISFIGSVVFENNKRLQNIITDNFREGGAVTLFQSNVRFFSTCRLQHNKAAAYGGAILASESKVYVTGNVAIAHNTAATSGGGMYLLNSELNCEQKCTLSLLNNTATIKGGGVHAISSLIKVVSWFTYAPSVIEEVRIFFSNNIAERGGGLSLEANAKLYILRYTPHLTDAYEIEFKANIADYGAAVYVDDDTNSGACAIMPRTECFFQVLVVYSESFGLIGSSSIAPCMLFSQNHANNSGSMLYGGLLDRCAVSQFAEVHKYGYQDQVVQAGVNYFCNFSTMIDVIYGNDKLQALTNVHISSQAVQLCLCKSFKHNCSHENIKDVKKGNTFTVSLVAVNQIGYPVDGTIHATLKFTESGLAEGQLTRKIHGKCTDLDFNIVSPHDTEELILYASDGPCKDAPLSRKTVKVHFVPCSCPVGLQVSTNNDTNCTCDCHHDIDQYVEQCDGHTGSFVRKSQSRAWISYINHTNSAGYLVYSNCPFDYCNSSHSPVDLNHPDGADALCAFNRSSLLCGSCHPGLSLSLGSSRCLLCPSYWPALFITITIVAILAGIALVALLLVLNMSVAVGTLNGLIFYANVVYASKSVLLPFQESNFLTVFIPWLNLELGIDTCYFPGMDTYTKTWLQLAFPTYVILLVVSVIIISSYSTRFSNLIGRKDPVATLATLILFSYARLLEICFKSLSVGILEYPDGSHKMLWLPDATVKYLSGKHIPLFIVAVLILLAGLVYTALLFSWQWLLYLPRWKIFKWSRDPKFQIVLQTYHMPYSAKHRYWTGLLLIVRAVMYFVAAVNVSNSHQIALTAIIFSVCCIVLLKGFIGSRVYAKWAVDVLETFFYLNILFFAIFTLYTSSDPHSNVQAPAYASVTITFIILLLIILYHVYTYTTVFSKFKTTKPGRMIDKWVNESDPKPEPKHQSPLPDDDIHILLDTIDRPVKNNDYRVSLGHNLMEPTHSVVEVHKPYITSSVDDTHKMHGENQTLEMEGKLKSCTEEKNSSD